MTVATLSEAPLAPAAVWGYHGQARWDWWEWWLQRKELWVRDPQPQLDASGKRAYVVSFASGDADSSLGGTFEPLYASRIWMSTIFLKLQGAPFETPPVRAQRGANSRTISRPTPLQLELIAEFQRTAPRFFSDRRLRRFAKGGAAPRLPKGRTASEKRGRKRGREFFVDAPFQPPSKTGVCALCHSGPMLNQANVFSTAVFGNPPGARAFSVGVSEANFMNNPTYTFLVHDGLGPPVPVTTPDIGILMTDPATPIAAETVPPPPVLHMFGLRLAFFANVFKTPTLWGVKDTAPYFHDNWGPRTSTTCSRNTTGSSSTSPSAAPSS